MRMNTLAARLFFKHCDQSEIRLPAGHVVIACTALHCVTPVTSGERFACVGWIESYVQSSDDRALLFNLESAAKGLLARHGRSEGRPCFKFMPMHFVD